MKLATAESPVIDSQGLKETKSFNIRATGKAFDILSSGLYSDKPRAVLREIGCNAVDAHIEAGCPERPILVKLPNVLDHELYVQDWGPGLSHEQAMELYTTYFASTKSGSNAYTGAFGLGSKSPFAYTDSFAVTSCHGGKMRSYALHKGDDGAPQISLMSESDVEPEWETGLRVSFACRPGDYAQFQATARDVFQWFKTPPTVLGAEPIVPLKWRFDCEDFGLLADNPQLPDWKPRVLMGGVCYPLDLEKLGLKRPDDQTDKSAAKVLANYATGISNLVLKMPIGTTEVSASRESLQYSPRTTKALRAQVELAVRRATKDAIEALEAALEGTWDEVCEAKAKIKGLVKGELDWSFGKLAACLGLPPERVKQLEKWIDKDYIAMPAFSGANAAVRLVQKVQRHRRGQGIVSVPTVYSVWGDRTHQGGQAKVLLEPGTVLAWGTSSGAPDRAKLAVSQGDYEQVVLVCRGTSNKKKMTDPAAIEAEAQAISKELRGMPVVSVSDLPELPPRLSYGRKKRKGPIELPPGEFAVKALDRREKAELKDIDPYFCCTRESTSWGNTRSYVRLYTGDKDDVSIVHDRWKQLWEAYAELRAAVPLKGGIESYVPLGAAQVRGYALPKLGWKNAYFGVKEFLAANNKEIADALREKAKKSKLIAAPSEMYQAGGWLGALGWMAHAGSLTLQMADLLRRAGLLETVTSLALGLKRRDSKASRDAEHAIRQYEMLTSEFGIAAASTSLDDQLTLEALDDKFAEKYPLSVYVDFKEALESPFAYDALIFVLSKEK